MIQIADLKLTQESLRLEEQLDLMVDYVKNGGKFTIEAIQTHLFKLGRTHRPSLISLNRFEDGELYVRDGHHRVGSIWLAGREYLHDDEYVIENYTYKEYLEINFESSYVTPFDPRSEVRFGNFYGFRQEVMSVFHTQGEAAAMRYIEENRHKYCAPRRLVNSIEGLFARFSEAI